MLYYHDVAHYEGSEIVDKLLELKSFIAEQVPTRYIVISHPVTRTDSKHLAMKIGYIQLHLHKLEIDIIENGKANSNHQNSKGLHLNGKDVLQFTKNLIEGIWKLRYEKELLRQKKYHWNHGITIAKYLQTIFYTIIFFIPM